MTFIESPPDTDPDPQPGPALYFIFSGPKILTDPNGAIPVLERAAAAGLCREDLFFFGHLDHTPCFCAALDPQVPDDAVPFNPVNLRTFFNRSDDTFRQAAGFARQILDLHTNARFCGRCGSATRARATEHARTCLNCRHTVYPRISPAIITAVTRENQILLARGVNFPDKKMFSVLAGFVSPAETLEDCVKREVYEETRIRVDNVRYVQSQSWPFPDSLMIGFTAEYRSGQIRIDPQEIVEAAWFDKNNLPVIPAPYTLAGRLIRSFAGA